MSYNESPLKGKHIVLGITGSIAAYKACILARLFVKAGAEVQVVITPSGKEFITPLTLSTLTSKPVVSEFFSRRDGSWNSHVEMGIWADAMVIAPATASTLAKMAHGIADNMLVTTYLSMKAPVYIAPAMDLDMYAHPSTQANLATLKSYGNIVIEAAEGELASHLVGKGRMAEPEDILEAVANGLSANKSRLAGKTVLITAGPTYERIDPVRFIGNFSSGKMGFALAEACAYEGAKVILVSGPVKLTTTNCNIKRIDVTSAAEMHEAATTHFPQCDAAILCAAVADYTIESPSPTKLKRKEGGKLDIKLKPTADIAADLGRAKAPNQKIVGFALETNNEQSNATKKMEEKNLDFIVLNSLNDKGAGFMTDTNKITIIRKDGTQTPYPLKPKKEVARDIIDNLCSLFD